MSRNTDDPCESRPNSLECQAIEANAARAAEKAEKAPPKQEQRAAGEGGERAAEEARSWRDRLKFAKGGEVFGGQSPQPASSRAIPDGTPATSAQPPRAQPDMALFNRLLATTIGGSMQAPPVQGFARGGIADSFASGLSIGRSIRGGFDRSDKPEEPRTQQDKMLAEQTADFEDPEGTGFMERMQAAFQETFADISQGVENAFEGAIPPDVNGYNEGQGQQGFADGGLVNTALTALLQRPLQTRQPVSLASLQQQYKQSQQSPLFPGNPFMDMMSKLGSLTTAPATTYKPSAAIAKLPTYEQYTAAQRKANPPSPPATYDKLYNSGMATYGVGTPGVAAGGSGTGIPQPQGQTWGAAPVPALPAVNPNAYGAGQANYNPNRFTVSRPS